MSTTQVRVTQEPHVVREVDEAGFIDLHTQGLIYSHNRGDGTSPHKWVSKKKGEDVETGDLTITDTVDTAEKGA